MFKTEGARAAFETCLFEACERSGWLLHAFVIMGNHYHLAVGTPKGNLVAGMQWLQSTYANRFNRLRGERGHLFQGRYKSLLVEAGDALGQVCHYLHLNPVRADIMAIERLGEYRSSSYWYLERPNQRPAFLRVEAVLTSAGQLPDQVAGWKSYANYLAWQAAEGPAGKNAAYVSLTQGWALGSGEFKEALLQDHAVATEARAWESEGVREVRAAQWRKALDGVLAGVPQSARKDKRKSASWKVAVAAHLKATTDVPNGWLAEQLEMGSPFYVSKHVGNLRKQTNGNAMKWLQGLNRV